MHSFIDLIGLPESQASQQINLAMLDSGIPELCADQLVVGGGVEWSCDWRRRRAAHFSSAAATSAASDRTREH